MKLWYFKNGNFLHKKDPAPAPNRRRKLVYLGNFEQRSLSCFILSFFQRPSPQIQTLDMGQDIQEWTK